MWGKQKDPQTGEGLSLEAKKKLRHKVCCVLHVGSSQQAFERQYLFIWVGFAVLYMLLPCSAWADLLLLLATHSHLCWSHEEVYPER